MAEYIERSSIKYEQWAVGPLCEPLMVVRKKTIDAIPAADVAPVVRCKDCVFREEPHIYGSSIIGELWCRLIGVPMNLDDFCSYGERRADNG